MGAALAAFHVPSIRRPYAIIFFLAAVALLLASRSALADPSAFYGTFEEDVPIIAPPFHELEPQLSLHYSSLGGNGPVGVRRRDREGE